MAVNGAALASAAAGAVLLYAGIRGKSVLSLAQTVIRGQAPGQATAANPIGSTTISLGSSGQTGTLVPGHGGPDIHSASAANRALGRIMAAAEGWATGQEWQALDYGWGTLESGWNNRIYYGGQVGGPYQPGLAYGIPAFLGHGPNGAPYPAGSPANPPGAGGDSSPPSQIRQGLAYIKGRYGSPSQVPGWLGQPGYNGY